MPWYVFNWSNIVSIEIAILNTQKEPEALVNTGASRNYIFDRSLFISITKMKPEQIEGANVMSEVIVSGNFLLPRLGEVSLVFKFVDIKYSWNL